MRNHNKAISVTFLASLWPHLEKKSFAIRPIKKWFLVHFWEPFKGNPQNSLLAFFVGLKLGAELMANVLFRLEKSFNFKATPSHSRLILKTIANLDFSITA